MASKLQKRVKHHPLLLRVHLFNYVSSLKGFSGRSVKTLEVKSIEIFF
jgi:hypothetical protein